MWFKENVYGHTMHKGRRLSSGEPPEKTEEKKTVHKGYQIRDNLLDTCMLCKSKIVSFTLCLQGNISYKFVVC